ncbi:hypothetical protein GLV98_02580 [Halobacillus litoralis]|uniref:Phage capsid protein n=1 Tax=Halobacillus litoralis TaxID=45668 RepID=A0A845DY55_9BACI|nr:DUF6366 family protein [Halobacillus litoralis]MYL48347.1 hypothetical protein [Halobacillus litoralis]
MSEEKPETTRERLRQEEWKKDPSGSIHGGGLPDFIGNLGWKGTGILILVLISGFIIYTAIYR